jgi:sugar lactone lactonase YvrE
VERIAGGFALAEAPLVVGDVLLVSDVMGGGVRRFDAGGAELEPLLEGRRGIGGMAHLPDGRIVVSGRDLSATDGSGTWSVLARLEEGGTGYNDIAVSPEGVLVAGMLTYRPFGPDEPTAAILVSVDPDGVIERTPVPFSWPNGIGFSPSGDAILVADFASGIVHRSPWTGRISDLRLEPWATSPSGDADGLAVAEDGDIWVAGGAGGKLLRFDAAGAIVEQLDVPDDFVSSCCLWPGSKRMVITTGTSVFFDERA